MTLEFITYFTQDNKQYDFHNFLECELFLKKINSNFNYIINEELSKCLINKYFEYHNLINKLQDFDNYDNIRKNLSSYDLILPYLSSFKNKLDMDIIIKSYALVNKIELNENHNTTLYDLLDINFWEDLFANNINNKKQAIINYLESNWVIKDITNKEKLLEALSNNKSAYIGFDPSFKSLHLGNYVMINILNILNKYGLNTYPMVGGATGMVGDPSGKSQERNLLDKNQIIENKNSIIDQLKQLCINKQVLDNYEHFRDTSFLDFLRDVGKYINVSYLLEKEIIKNRLQTGISFTEFSYTLIQGYDFYYFYSTMSISIQIGGSDQWGNITTGCELIRKLYSEKNDACGFTINLLTNSEGKKFGKSEKGAIYLDKNLTSPYKMFQFLINQTDEDTIKLLLFLTSMNPIIYEYICKLSSTDLFKRLRLGQHFLTKLVIEAIHTQEDYNEAYLISKKLFNQEYNSLSLTQLDDIFDNDDAIKIHIDTDLNVVDFLDKLSILGSRREIRELISNNSIVINGERINNINLNIDLNFYIFNKYIFIKKGKKNFFVIIKK